MSGQRAQFQAHGDHKDAAFRLVLGRVQNKPEFFLQIAGLAHRSDGEADYDSVGRTHSRRYLKLPVLAG